MATGVMHDHIRGCRLIVLKHRMRLAIALNLRERMNTFAQVKREFGYTGRARKTILAQFLAQHFPGESV
jgi:hypothetical protein